MAPVAGVRHIWQDEAETAERARSILAYGVPRVIDPEGRISLNAGGREIEEGTLHRYTPWGQFYVGAAGLAIGRTFGLSDDTSLRLPFVFLHAASSSLLSYGLAAACGWPVAAAVGVSTLYGFQSVRILSNRSARYHAALDFLLLLGLVGFAMRGNRTGSWLIGLSVFLLPQMHTLGGAVLASTLVLLLLVDAFIDTRSVIEVCKREGIRSAGAGLLSILLILILCRPWLQQAWTAGHSGRIKFSLNSTLEISYSFYIFAFWLAFLAWRKEWRALAMLSVMGAYIFASVKLLEANPFNQPRYYYSVPILFLFWPFVTGWLEPLKKARRWAIPLFAVSVVMSDAQGIIPYFQGIRVVAADYKMNLKEEPLRAAFAQVPSGESILVDYVPQFANWYLRTSPVALMPRPIGMTKLNETNEWFSHKRIEPQWHVYYENQDGLWPCFPNCDYRRKMLSADSYELLIDADKVNPAELVRFCIQERWAVDKWNNAPFSGYNPAAIKPEGDHNETLVLARKCSK